MSVLVAARNAKLTGWIKSESPALPPAFVGAATRAAAKACKSTSNKVIELAAHGFSNGDLVVFTAIVGGTGLQVARPYNVAGVTTNTFELTFDEAEAWSTELTAGTEIAKVTEVTGGAYARVASSYTAAKKGATTDSTSHSLSIPASTTVNYITNHTLITVGSMVVLDSIEPEAFTLAGTLADTTGKVDMNGSA